MVLVVIAGAAMDLGRRQQTAGLVGANVADRHPRPPRQLPDRQLAVGRGGLRLAAAHLPMVSGRRCPFIFLAASEQRNATAAAMSSAGVKVGNSFAGSSSRMRGVRIASTTTSVQASAAALAAA